MLHELVEVRVTAKYGQQAANSGLIARGHIPAGTVVWWWDHAADAPLRSYSRKDIVEHPQRETLSCYSYMLDHDSYGSTPDPKEDTSYYFNHSCDGTCWYDSDEQVVTKRDVEEGEELTYHYGLTDTEASLHAGMTCMCGSIKCQGVLQLDGYRDPEFMQENAGHTSAFIARKATEVGWHHPDVYLVKKNHGQGEEEDDMGLFTLKPIAKGEVLLHFGGKVVGKEQFLKIQQKEQTMHFVQVASALWMVPTRDGSETPDFINHSCDPNCGMLDSVTVLAMKDIGADEELSIDYGTVMDETIEDTGLESFDCKCGAVCCRGRVTPHDYRIPALQLKYKGFFPPFMQLKLDMRAPL